VYSVVERWLPCDSCGNATQIPNEGLTGFCPHCRAPIQFGPRPDTTVPASPPTDEKARRERLRPQDGKPLLPPPGFEQLISGSEVPPHKMQEARMIWSATRKQLAAQPGDFAASDRLSWLTMILRNTLTDERQIRALVEGALEVLILPRHRQGLRGDLSRGATKLGDLESAEAWLAGCDPRSEDLQCDTPYRVSYALLETARGRFHEVLVLLGGTEEEVPIEDLMDGIATVLRANAWERMGRVDAAESVLTKFMARGGQARVIEAIIAAMPPSWTLCPQSIQVARGNVRAASAERAGAAGGGAMFGWIFALAGGGIPLVVFVVLLATEPFEFPILFMLLFPLIFGTVGGRMILAANRAKRIAKEGIHAQGTIVATTLTGTRINDVPVIRIDVAMDVPGHGPRKGSAKRLMYPTADLVGRVVPIIWHPKYPDEVVVDL
jgi:hypothetical protein